MIAKARCVQIYRTPDCLKYLLTLYANKPYIMKTIKVMSIKIMLKKIN